MSFCYRCNLDLSVCKCYSGSSSKMVFETRIPNNVDIVNRVYTDIRVKVSLKPLVALHPFERLTNPMVPIRPIENICNPCLPTRPLTGHCASNGTHGNCEY